MTPILHLQNLDKSDFKYKISHFPDGQQSLTIDVSNITVSEFVLVEIRSRLNSFKDLELIICANQALKRLGVKNVSLYVPYFLGARSDRQFEKGGVHYLKDVICPIINSQNFSTVSILDPHSDVLEMGIANFKKIRNPLYDTALGEIESTGDKKAELCLVSPDAGAYKKIFDVAMQYQYENILTATKVRDVKTGKILRTEVPSFSELPVATKFVIIDDICDGGRTFIELAKIIKERRGTAAIYLVVTHGIFSAGFVELTKYFDAIYTTNSVKDIEPGLLTNFVKQVNVF